MYLLNSIFADLDSYNFGNNLIRRKQYSLLTKKQQQSFAPKPSLLSSPSAKCKQKYLGYKNLYVNARSNVPYAIQFLRIWIRITFWQQFNLQVIFIFPWLILLYLPRTLIKKKFQLYFQHCSAHHFGFEAASVIIILTRRL